MRLSTFGSILCCALAWSPPLAAQDVPSEYQQVLTVGRDGLKVTEMGAPINARMGLNTWAAFVGTNANAAVAGDVAMLASEVMPGAASAPQERARCDRHPPSYDRHAPDDLLSALLGHRPD